MDYFTEITGKSEDGRRDYVFSYKTSAVEEFGIAHSIVSQAWRAFTTTGTSVRKISSDFIGDNHPRGTTSADDIVSYRREEETANRSGGIPKHMQRNTGRTVSHFTVAIFICMANSSVCAINAFSSEKSFFVRCQDPKNWTDQQ